MCTALVPNCLDTTPLLFSILVDYLGLYSLAPNTSIYTPSHIPCILSFVYNTIPSLFDSITGVYSLRGYPFPTSSTLTAEQLARWQIPNMDNKTQSYLLIYIFSLLSVLVTLVYLHHKQNHSVPSLVIHRVSTWYDDKGILRREIVENKAEYPTY